MLIDKGTRTGVSILYVSVPRCSKRCHGRISGDTYVAEKNTNLELNGEHRGKPLDRESFVRLLRDLPTLLTGPVFNREILRLRKSVGRRVNSTRKNIGQRRAV